MFSLCHSELFNVNRWATMTILSVSNLIYNAITCAKGVDILTGVSHFVTDVRLDCETM